MQRCKTIQWWALVIAFGGALNLFLFIGEASAQEKRRVKFGSSLKRLKWDKSKNAAIDKETGKEAARNRPSSSDDPDVIRIDTSLVVFDLQVKDQQGRVVNGLSKEDFVVVEDGAPQQINTFATGDAAVMPRSIVLIIDHSGSQIPYLETSVTAAKILVEQLRPQDKMAIVSDDIELVQEFTNDQKHLKVVLDSMRRRVSNPAIAWSRSQQYSALFAVLQELVVKSERPVIIFQTDGDELFGLQGNPIEFPQWSDKVSFSMNDLITAAYRERVTIYSVISSVQIMGLPPTERLWRIKQMMESRWGLLPVSMRELSEKEQKTLEKPMRAVLRWQEALARVASATGGWHDFLEYPEQATAIYERILNSLNQRYLIGYYPTNETRDGAMRTVHFAVRDHPEYVILGRRSYYAPPGN